MAQAENGNTVKVHYKGKLDDGTVFESTFNHDPVQFVIGQGERIPGFEEALIGMSPGDRKTTRIPAKEAHGLYNKELLVVIERSEFPADLKLEAGQPNPPALDFPRPGNVILDSWKLSQKSLK